MPLPIRLYSLTKSSEYSSENGNQIKRKGERKRPIPYPISGDWRKFDNPQSSSKNKEKGKLSKDKEHHNDERGKSSGNGNQKAKKPANNKPFLPLYFKGQGGRMEGPARTLELEFVTQGATSSLSYDLLAATPGFPNGIRRMSKNNEAFLMKLGWGILTLPNALWVKVLHSKYMREEVGVPQPVAKSGDSPLWKGICKVWDS
ncbi:hypothetical protein S83_067050 [Arachis hypogaea]